ncbi:MAG: extracellular solute-binding protein [Spirochaetaceae bacterium]|jgi:multiple sugar transport system substrate-binding protein|nr:extracellular solute-binding protein [Spirochaetaceae bacterium]
MKDMMKLLLAVFVIAAFPGCQARETKTSSTPPPPPQAEEFTFWNQVFETWNVEYFEKKAAQYNALNRAYRVNQEFVTGDAWTERMTAAIASNTAPDGYVIAYNNIRGGVVRGELMPLNGLVPQAALDDIHDNVKSMVTFDGKVYAYPQLVEPSAVLFYRKDLFEQAGLTRPPRTWEELIEYGKRLSTRDMYGLAIGDFAAFGWCTWGAQYAVSGHLAINDNWDAPLIDNNYRDLANFYRRLYAEKVVPEQSLAGYTNIEPFGLGYVAMQICGSWGVAGIINDYPEVADLFAVAPVPTKDGNQDKPTATNGGWTFVIDAKTSHAPAMADYIYWLLGDDPAIPAEFFEIAQYSKSSPRKSVDAYIAQHPAGDADWAESIAYVASRAIPEPVYPWDISVAVSTMFENVALNGVNVDAAAEEAIRTINEVIRNNELAGKNPAK